MFTRLLSAAAVCVLGTMAAPAFADGTLQTDDEVLQGEMDIGGVYHDVTIALDRVRYGNGCSHKAWIINQFSGGTPTTVTPTPLDGVNIKCSLDGGAGPGFKINYAPSSNAAINGTAAFAGCGGPTVTCNAKKGNGSQPPENLDTFTLQ